MGNTDRPWRKILPPPPGRASEHVSEDAMHEAAGEESHAAAVPHTHRRRTESRQAQAERERERDREREMERD